MCEAVGHPVLELQRIAFGPLRLADCPRAIAVSASEIERLRARRQPDASRGRRAAALCDNRRAWHDCSPCAARSRSRPTTPSEILDATTELLKAIIERNALAPDNVVSCIFTATSDLNAEFPAVAARALGFDRVPLLCARELDVPGALPTRDPGADPLLRAESHDPARLSGRGRALRSDLRPRSSGSPGGGRRTGGSSQ